MGQIPDSSLPPGTLSCRQYAKRRGVSPMAVSVAIKDGRLSRSVGRDTNGQPKIIDPELADKEWLENTDAARRVNAGGGFETHPQLLTTAPVPIRSNAPREEPGPAKELDEDGNETQGSATARLKSRQADMADLKYREAAGELVVEAEVRRGWLTVCSAVKGHLLGLPNRLKQAVPNLSVKDVELLTKLVRESLEELSEMRVK